MKKSSGPLDCWEPESVVEITVQVTSPGRDNSGVVVLIIDKDDLSNLEQALETFFEDLMGQQVWHASIKSTKSVYYPGKLA